jgi:hypothetical protein
MPASVDGVVDVQVFAQGTPAKWLFIEVPHGATRASDYESVASQLKSPLPAQLEHFFYVNTDIGAPEGAAWLAHELSKQGVGVVVARCLIPRTFIDTNRVVEKMTAGQGVAGMTAAVPSYVSAPADLAWLKDRHAEYHRVVGALYQELCGNRNARVLQLHSYAPRSVGITRTDEHIVEALHAAYVPEVYATWPERPAVDLICATEDGSFRAPEQVIARTVSAYTRAGIEVTQNATYHLHPVAMGYVYAKAWPDRVLCVELNRGLVADPFTPFGVSPISEAKIARMVGPLVEVFLS